MRHICAGVTGNTEPTRQTLWSDLDLVAPWPAVAQLLSDSPTARPVQARALTAAHLLDTRRNLIVSAPTNSGKSLIGWLALLSAVRNGQRAVLIEPLRAIADEKAQQMREQLPKLIDLLACPVSISVSTGDYRLDDETLASPPPNQGEIIIATPERLEAILRNPRYQPWLQTIGALCIDEAHLLSEPRRGPVLEHVVTSFLCMPAPPRFVFLSATIGDAEAALAWLSPCDFIHSQARNPVLYKHVVQLAPEDDVDDTLQTLATDILQDPAANLLIFVYQTRSAESLARRLSAHLQAYVSTSALAYHGQMSAQQRHTIQADFRAGHCRCLVTTTALSLGVNLPATHVIVRDITFPGVKTLSTGELLQMMGRAGRHDQPGHATVFVRPTDRVDATALAQNLTIEHVADLRSAWTVPSQSAWSHRSPEMLTPTAGAVASLLVRDPEQGISLPELERYFSRSLGGHALVAQLPAACAWLTDPMRALAYADPDNHYRLTVLGTRTTRAMIPLSVGAGVGQLLRDLLQIDPADQLLGRWQPLDHLILLHLLFDQTPSLRAYSRALVDQVDGWMERQPGEASLLYTEWIRGTVQASAAEQLLGSLGLPLPGSIQKTMSWAHQRAYLASFSSIVMLQRSHGVNRAELTRQMQLRNLEGVEERWRDTMLWLLAGLGPIFEIRSVFYHLRTACNADPVRIKRVKRTTGAMRAQTYTLLDTLKYCSPLGTMLHEIRRTTPPGKPKVGHETIRTLETKGITEPRQLANLTATDLQALGLQPRFAQQITHHIRRRLR